jgi:hypothetical protein
MRTILSDPPAEKNPEAVLRIDVPRALGEYYSVFAAKRFRVERGLTEVGAEIFHTIVLPGGAGVLGLHEELHRALSSEGPDGLAQVLPEFLASWSTRWLDVDVRDGAVGLDGVLLRGPAMFVGQFVYD